MPKRIPAIAVVGDLHANSVFGLMPPTFRLDAGNVVKQNKYQKWLWQCWLNYCSILDSYNVEAIIINGDVPQGINPDRDSEIITINEADQFNFGVEVLRPLINRGGKPKIYCMRGTGFHSGKAGSREEMIAREIGAEKDVNGSYSRYALWLEWRDKLVFATHHVSTGRINPHAGLWREMKESRGRAADGWPLPDIDFRSHIHHCYSVQDNSGRQIVTAPAWQLTNEHGHKIAAGDLPHIGGLVVCKDESNEVQVRPVLYPLPQPIIEHV